MARAALACAIAAFLLPGVASAQSAPEPASEEPAKPEIGAPGGSVSAIYGTGSGTEAFSGTSGA